jgi:tetratricopeptide (TPR) repeat protein
MQWPRRRRSVTAEKHGVRDNADVSGQSGDLASAGLSHAAPSRTWFAGLLLVSGTILAYLPVWHAGFIWDDRSFVVDNPLIHRADGLYRFWFTAQPIDFYPVTSTMLWAEWRVWGANPAAYHVVNVLLHSLSAVLLWRVLKRLEIAGSWLAAALFAVHPVNVESVAWIAERKNTLAMVFYLASLLGYVRADLATRPSAPSGASSEGASPTSAILTSRWYWLSVGAFLLALLSKTVVAPMPLVLLGVAWWRRGRVDRQDAKRTGPFFALSLAVGLVSLWFQSHRAIGADVVRTDSFWARLAGAGWAIWFYLYKAIVPFGLSTIYPRWQIDERAWWSYVPGLLVAGGGLAFWRARRSWGRGPLGAFGYFVVMLLPVLGFLDIGFMRASLVADHWQYFAIIGPISLAAGAIATPRFLSGTGFSPAPALAGILLTVLGALTWKQSSLYVDPGTFWQAAVASNPSSWAAHSNLGDVLFERGHLDDAAAHFQAALDLEPSNPTAHYNLGGVLREQGRLGEAATQFRKALDLQPNYSAAHYNLGEILRQRGQVDEAIAHFGRAVEIRPDYAEAHECLAFLLLREGEVDEGVAHLRAALAIHPDNAEDHNNLAGALWQKGQAREAILHYERAIEIRPDYAVAHQGLGEILEHEGRTREAISHYEKALGAEADNPQFLGMLAAAYAEAGRFPDAMETATLALQRATAQHRTMLANRLRTQIAGYQAGSPVRERGREGN